MTDTSATRHRDHRIRIGLGDPTTPARSNAIQSQQNLSREALIVVLAACTAGATAVGRAAGDIAAQPTLKAADVVLVVVLSLVTAASWMWPLIIYRGTDSEAAHLDEAVVVIMALLLPAAWTILAFAAAILVAQLLRRRALLKAAFNFGQLSVALAAALAISHAIAAPTHSLTVGAVLGVTLGAVAFFALNSGLVGAILAATGTSWRAAVVDGLVVRLSLVGVGIAVGVVIGIAISAYRWSLPVAIVLLFMLRQVLVAQFHGYHDRQRLRGLLDATLRANRNLSQSDVFDAIFHSVRELLRCDEVTATETRPTTGELGARLFYEGADCWLIASGRSRAEPFDSADSALLETSAAVGAAALTNAILYQQVAAITSSLGEGVCALDGSGDITFCNPAAAQLLGRSAAADDSAPRIRARNPEAPDFLRLPARAAMKSGQVVRDDDATFQAEGGRQLPVSFSASPILDNGVSVGAVIAFRDLSDRKALEAERKQAQIELDDIERVLHQAQRLESLGQLAGGVAHDFNNLLGVISNYASFVSEKVAEAASSPGGEDWHTANQDIQQIERAVQRASGLTHQLLAFARREVVQPQVLNLNRLVTGIQPLLSRTLGEHVTLITNLADELSPVMADPGQLEQILVNLAVNARTPCRRAEPSQSTPPTSRSTRPQPEHKQTRYRVATPKCA